MIEMLDETSRLVWTTVLFLSIQGGLAGIAALVLARWLRRFSPVERSTILLLGLFAFLVPFRSLLPGLSAPRRVELVHPSVGGLDAISLSLTFLYLGGAAVALAALLRQRLELGRILRSATPLATTGNHPPVVVSDDVAVPFAARPLAPVVVLPAALVRRMTPQRMEHVLRHERAHVRHGDLWINLVTALVRALFWFHPVARVLARELVAAREELCDDAVIRAGCAPAAYGATLVRAAALVSSSRASVRVAFTGGEFERLAARLRRLGTAEAPHPMVRRATVLVACAAVACSVMLAVPDLRIGAQAASGSGPVDHRESHRASHLARHHG